NSRYNDTYDDANIARLTSRYNIARDMMNEASGIPIHSFKSLPDILGKISVAGGSALVSATVGNSNFLRGVADLLLHSVGLRPWLPPRSAMSSMIRRCDTTYRTSAFSLTVGCSTPPFSAPM